MKLMPNRNRLRVAALTFLCGLTLSWALRPAQYAATPLIVESPSPPPAAQVETHTPREAAVPYLDWAESPEGEAWKHRNNGWPLRLRYATLGAEDIDAAKVWPLPGGRVLVAAGETLHMFDAGGQSLWERHESQPIFDFAYVEATGLVYVTAGDNNLFILEAWTGRELHRESRNGRAGFGQAVAYGKDMCLVTDNNAGYRANEDFIPPMSDGVTAWRGTKMLWHQKLPPDAELRVSGNSIFAVTKTSSRVLVTTITPPAR